MTPNDERLPALGQPVEEPTPEGDHDFAGEHDATVVDQGITSESDAKETESPKGWSGMDSDGAP